jgi:hypothetical protein
MEQASKSPHYLIHMKINLLTSALVAILGLALAGAPVTAQAKTTSTTDATPAAPAKEKKKSDKTTFKGEITAIDATSVTITHKDKAKTLTLAITPKTVFRVDEANAAAADFAVGDKVSGSYSKDAAGAMTATLIHKKSASAKK